MKLKVVLYSLLATAAFVSGFVSLVSSRVPTRRIAGAAQLIGAWSCAYAARKSYRDLRDPADSVHPALAESPDAQNVAIDHLGQFASRRFGITHLPGRTLIRIGPPVFQLILGCALVAVFLIVVGATVRGLASAESTEVLSKRIVGLVIGFPLLILTCPWWWFLSREFIEVGHHEITYRRGVFILHRTRSFQLREIANLRSNPNLFRGLIGNRILFEYSPDVGMTFSFGKNLTDEETPAVISFIQARRAQVTGESRMGGTNSDFNRTR